MADPDAPSRLTPIRRNIWHWGVVNIPAGDFSQGEQSCCCAAISHAGECGQFQVHEVSCRAVVVDVTCVKHSNMV